MEIQKRIVFAVELEFTLSSLLSRAPRVYSSAKRWTNPVAEEEDAALFLWTRDGRPEAAAQFFVRKDNWMHEFQSLSAKGFAVEWDGREIWAPEKPGVTLARSSRFTSGARGTLRE